MRDTDQDTDQRVTLNFKKDDYSRCCCQVNLSFVHFGQRNTFK